MRQFYALVASAQRESFDADEAARLEVEWWRVHRFRQRDAPAEAASAVGDALTALYAHAYGADAVRLAAAQRALAAQISDRWVEDGGDPTSRALWDERAALVRSYAALLAAVHR
jgi:hypothetical protein